MGKPPNVKELSKITLGTEDSPDDAPNHYVEALESFLKTNPMDIHFIMELGREGQNVGGNGFGSVTCMEDYCWEDIILDADPALDIGVQRKNGLGSFFNFKVHCQVEKHVRGRNERCRKEGITIAETKDPFAPASSVSANRTLPQPATSTSCAPPPNGAPRSPKDQDNLLDTLMQMDEKARKDSELASRPPVQPPWLQAHQSQAGPSRASKPTWQQDIKAETGWSKYNGLTTDLHSSSPSRPQDRLISTSNALQPIDPNNWLSRSRSTEGREKTFGSSTFGTMSNKGKTIMIDDDDDDDDIIELTNDRVPPGMRKSNKAPPIMVLDEDVKPSLGSHRGSSQSSFMSGPSRSTGNGGMAGSSQSNSQNKSNKATPFLPKREVRERYQKELTHLKIAFKAYGTGISKNDAHRKLVSDRYYQVERFLIMANSSPMWHPPSEELMNVVPSIRAMVMGFDRATTPASAAGTSVTERKPYPFEEYRDPSAGPSQPPIPPMTRPSDLPPHVHNRMAHVPDQYRNMPGAFPGMMDIKPAPSNDMDFAARARAYLSDPAAAAMDFTARMRSAIGMGGPSGALGSAGLGVGQDMEDLVNSFAEPNRPDNLQDFFSNSLNSFDEDQDVEGALKYLDLRDLQSRFRDLSVTLMPHQVLGVKFMIEQEKKRKMKGGLLADSMGLGKTLSSIAVIAGHPSEDRKVKTTLVVAPLALLQQWKSEIESKTTSGRKVLIHWGPKRSNSPAQLKQYDVVLTTYGILTAEHGKQKRKGKAKQNDSDESDDGGLSLVDPLKQGPLFKVLWYRVVLDEAHMIRNQTTRAAKAAFDLNSIYRWCLTGTPVMNSLGDLYPILHFLNISPQADLKEFRAHISKVERKRPRLAANRMQAILKTCSIRRNKDSTLNGVRLLNLPPKIISWDELELTVDERHIYTSIENRMQVKFNALLKRGTVLKHYSMVLVMLVRLKQATSHPFLLTRRAEDAAHPEDVVISDEELLGTRDAALLDDMKELQRALDNMGQEYVDKVAQMLEDRWKEVQKHPEGAADSDQVGTECAICFEPYEHEHAERITECCHSYCATCMENLWNDEPRTTDLTDAQLEKNMRQCPLCREPISREKVFRASAFFNPEEQADIKPQIDGEESTSAVKANGKRASEDPDEDVKPALKKLTMSKGKGRASDFSQAVEDKPKPKPEAINYDELDITPSTKMRHLLAVIQEKLQDPSVKVVAYSQFTSFLDLCGAYLSANGISALMYQGCMAAGERQETLNSFNTPPDLEGGHHRVLLLSLKAGGVGLNLTVSNTVIALDLAWNAATEDQAVDRCHRIGQVREVDVRRLCVKNSIDERIRDLQENKRKLADGALGEGEGGKLGRLSINDLIRLFNVDGGGHDV